LSKIWKNLGNTQKQPQQPKTATKTPQTKNKPQHTTQPSLAFNKPIKHTQPHNISSKQQKPNKHPQPNPTTVPPTATTEA
jgi:hypothetical protein